MTVREVIEELSKCDPDYVVIMSKDAEGNGYSPLSDVVGDNNVYVPECDWSGELRLHHLTDELRRQSFSEEDVYDGPDGLRAVVLWPTN